MRPVEFPIGIRTTPLAENSSIELAVRARVRGRRFRGGERQLQTLVRVRDDVLFQRDVTRMTDLDRHRRGALRDLELEGGDAHLRSADEDRRVRWDCVDDDQRLFLLRR